MLPVVFYPHPMLATWDCGVTALATLLGVPYAEVRRCIRAKNPDGLTIPQIRRIAARLGHPTRWVTIRTHADLDDHEDKVGLLSVEKTDGSAGHVVVYGRGIVIDPADNAVWIDVDAYLKDGPWEVEGLVYVE